MGHQIFISYRREGGESLAHLLYERLTREGYDVFLDVESLRSGKFNIALYGEIESCTDFLLLLPPHGLDRCADPKDWVRLEVEHAIRCEKNIIPVMMRGFDFPAKLPDTLAELPSFNGIKADLELFDGVILRLKNQLLRSRPVKGPAATRFPVTEDPDFPDWFRDYLNDGRGPGWKPKGEDYYKNLHPDLFTEIYCFHLAVQGGHQCLTPRKPFLEQIYGDHNYRLYDVFTFLDDNNKLAKYAYAIQTDAPSGQLPKCAFFAVDQQDQLRLIDPSSQEFRNLLLYYAPFIRLLDLVPRALIDINLKDALNQYIKDTGFDLSIALYGATKQYTKDDLTAVLENYGGLFDWLYSKEMNKGLIFPTIQGFLKPTLLRPKLFVSINNVVSYNYGVSVKLPTNNHLIVDLVTVFADSMWIAMAYPFEKKRKSIHFLRKPVFFLISKDKNQYITIEPYDSSSNDTFFTQWTERFALIDSLMEYNCGYLFEIRLHIG